MTLLLGTEAINVLRRKQWRAGRRTMLLETADTNHCPRSEDLSLWTLSGVGVTTGGQTDPNGGSTAFLLDDTDAAGIPRWSSPALIAYSGSHTVRGFSFFCKSNTAAVSNFRVFDTTAAAVRAGFNITWTAGVPSLALESGTGVLVAIIPVTDQPGWYRILVDVSGLTVANGHRIDVRPAGLVAGDVGSAYFWGFHAHSNCTPARQYHGPTGSGSLNSGGDLLLLPWNVTPGALTFYARYYEEGMQKRSVIEGQSQRVFELSGNTANDPRLLLYHQQPSPEIRMAHNQSVGTVISQTVGLPTLVYGDKVEALGLIYPDGSVQVVVRVNGGAPFVGARSAGSTFPAAWSPDGLISSQRIKPFSYAGGTGEVEAMLATPGNYTLDEAASVAR